MEQKVIHTWLLLLLLVIQNGTVAHPVNTVWGLGFPWPAAHPHSVHPYLHWSLFHQLPNRVFSVQPPLIPNLYPNWLVNRAENRLFPSAYGKTEPYNRAEHRLFPSHPNQDLMATRSEHRSIMPANVPVEMFDAEAIKTQEDANKTQEDANKTQEDANKTQEGENTTQEDANKTQEDSTKTQEQYNKTMEVENKSQENANKTLVESFRNPSKPQRKMSKRQASTPEPSAVIFPETSPIEDSSKLVESSSETTFETQKKSVAAEDKKISTGGKFVLDGLSLIAGSILGGGSMGHHYNPLLASPAGFFPPPPPLHPSYPPFLFPGPSAIYPNFVPPPYHPMALGQQSYFPAPSTSSNPYQPMHVDSLLVPLVGLVGLSLLVPDIIKTRREGRPSDLGGLDVYRYLSEDEECLRRLACEAGVTIADNDDSITIQRALERALSAKRLIPEQQMGTSQSKTPPQCGQHSCASWITESATESSSLTIGR